MHRLRTVTLVLAVSIAFIAGSLVVPARPASAHWEM